MLTEDMPFRAPVVREGVYFLTPKRAPARPGPADDVEPQPLRRVALGDRALAGRARRGAGVTLVPETTARTLLVSGGRVVGIRTGDKGRGKDGEELAELRARLRHPRARHDPGGGHAGTPRRHRARSASGSRRARRSTRWASRRSGRSRSRSTGSSTRWAGRFAAGSATASSAAASSTRSATTESPSGMVVGLDYTDATLSVHDLLQELKTHPFVRGHPRRRARASPGGRRRSPRAASRRFRTGSLPGRDDRRATRPAS